AVVSVSCLFESCLAQHLGCGLCMVVSPHFLRHSSDMPTDQLSEVLRLVEARSAITGGFAVGGNWTTRFELELPLKFMAMVAGSAVLRTDGVAGPVEMGVGDVVVL